MDQTDTQPTDEQLAVRLQAGDKAVFGIFVDRYESKLSRYGKKFLSRSEDIEDIVQEVFMSAYQNIQSFDATQKFSPWIYRIAHNAYVDALRKNSRSPITLFDFDTLISHHVYEDPHESERDQADMKKMIEVGLDQLASHYREVLVLYYLEDLAYKEIAEVLHVPTTTVGVRIKRAKEALKTIYEKMNIHYGA